MISWGLFHAMSAALEMLIVIQHFMIYRTINLPYFPLKYFLIDTLKEKYSLY